MDDFVIKQRLMDLEFVYMFFVGISTPKEKRYVDGREVWCDDYFTAVIEGGGSGIALLGFHLSKEALFIEQMQGIPGVNVKGKNLGVLLIKYGEKLARVLDRDIVCVQSARNNSYWDLDEDHRLYPQLYTHQDRLRTRYDNSAKQCGYDTPICGYSWWHKIIRKRLTFARWLRLQAVLFDRSARNRLPFVREFELVE